MRSSKQTCTKNNNSTAPFYERYWKKLQVLQNSNETDPIFCNTLLKPLWHIIIDLVDQTISHFSNAYIEAYIKQYKYLVLENKTEITALVKLVENWKVTTLVKEVERHIAKALKSEKASLLPRIG